GGETSSSGFSLYELLIGPRPAVSEQVPFAFEVGNIIQINSGDHQFIAFGLGLRQHPPGRGDDLTASDIFSAIFNAGSPHGNDKELVFNGRGTQQHLRGLLSGLSGLAEARGVVRHADKLCSPERQGAVTFRETAVIAHKSSYPYLRERDNREA